MLRKNKDKKNDNINFKTLFRWFKTFIELSTFFNFINKKLKKVLFFLIFGRLYFIQFSIKITI